MKHIIFFSSKKHKQKKMDSDEWNVGNDILMALDNNYSSSDLSPHSTDSDLHLSANPPFDPTQPFEEPPQLLQADPAMPEQSPPHSSNVSIKQEIFESVQPQQQSSASENVKSNPR